MLVLSNPRVMEFASGLRVEEDLVIGTTGLGLFVRLFSDRQSPSPRRSSLVARW
jgi:hypothetical protein